VTGALFVVSTPIGNLDDMTYRAVNTLKDCDMIACEDTRHTKILLDRYGISKPLISFFSYNQVIRTDKLVCDMAEGKKIALVSDAGTPGISDPGYVLIRAAIDTNIPVIPIPGPSAIISALVVSGKPTNKFIFEGFLSNKSSQRKKRLKELKDEKRTLVFYESPHRIAAFIKDVVDEMGDRDIVIVRELTKKFEEIQRNKASALLKHYTEHAPKGEFTVII